MSDKIQSACPACNATFAAPISMIGKSATCPKCSATFKLVVKAEKSAPEGIELVSSPRQPDAGNVQPRGSSAFGIVALILGIVAILTSWIPFLGVVGVLLALLSLSFAGIGTFQAIARNARGIGLSIAGGTLAAIAIVIFAVVHLVIGRTVDRVEDIAKKAKERLERVGKESPFGSPPDLPLPPGPPPIFERPAAKDVRSRPAGVPPIFEPLPAKSNR